MTHYLAKQIASSIKEELPRPYQDRLKAIHVMPKLTEGVLNIRLFFFPISPPDPQPFIFKTEEI